MIFINRQIEKLNEKIINEFDKNTNENKHPNTYKLFHVLPLRTSMIPCNITLDTPALIKLFMVENQAYYLANYCKENLYDEIWGKFFNMKDKIFTRKGYQFNHMIKTDGLSCSVVFVKTQNNIPYQKPSFGVNKMMEEECMCKYIEDTIKGMTDDEIKQLTNMNHVFCDPGKTEPINCLGKHIKTGEDIGFKYSQKQRNDDVRKNRYIEIRSDLKKNHVIRGKMVEEHEQELLKYNSKTTNFEQFKIYIKEKTKINEILKEYYAKETHRQLNWNTYNNTKRSEDLMMNRFEKIYGSSKECIIILGDYSEKNSKKGNEPSVTRKIRKIFMKRGYKVYLIDEFRTSKLCCHCCGENENFVEVIDDPVKKKTNKIKLKNEDIMKINAKTLEKIKKHEKLEKGLKELAEIGTVVINKDKKEAKKEDKKEGQKKSLVWKLLRCTTKNCKTIHNRDVNATKNMRKIFESLIKTKERPKEYRRKNESLDP